MRVLQCRFLGEEEWEEWQDSDLDLNEWDLDVVTTIEYRVVEIEEETDDGK